MSGHSKWHKIRHQKGMADAKKGAIFTKLGNAITLAAKQGGGDSDTNFSLRLAVEKAKQSNVPKENIERAIKRGTGELGGNILEEIVYEGFLPNQIPIIIETLTDNKNRTITELKNILNKYGGSIIGPGAVMWMFDKRGVIIIDRKQLTEHYLNELELMLIDVGVEDIEKNNKTIVVYTKPEELQKVKESLDAKEVKSELAELQFVTKEKINISNGVSEKVEKIFNQLEENDDVTNYYTNIKQL